VITSPNNRKVSQAVSLKKRAFRERNRRFLVEGAGSVEEAIGNAGRLETLFHSDPADGLVERARAAGASVLRVSEGVMGRLASTVTPPGLVGVAAFLDVPLASLAVARGCVVVLHAVRDPGNAGAVLRSTDAAGGDAVVFGGTSVDVYNPKTVRASAGSMFHVPIVRGVETVPALEQLRERGMRVLATDPEGDEDLFQLDLSTPSAFLFGNEAWGLPPEVAEIAETTPPSYEAPSPHHTTPEKVVANANPNYVLALAVDQADHKWFGTWGAGLSRFDGKYWKTYTKKDGLGGNFIHTVAIDPKGTLWVGTDGGVSKFDGKNWKTYTTRDGLLNNNVFSIAFDHEGHKWFGTWKGLSKLEEP